MTTATVNESFQEWRASIANSDAGERINLIRAGISSHVLVSGSDYFGMPRAQFAKLIGMSPATAERKIKNHSLLGSVESERLERLAIIEDLAEKTFGNSDKAKMWLLRKNLVFGDDTPLSMLDTETGAGEVKKVLASIAYGGAV